MVKSLLPNKRNIHIWLTAMTLLCGVLFLHWDPLVIIYAYLFETIVVGLLHIIKLYFVVKYSEIKPDKTIVSASANGYWSILIFFLNYFFFVALQMAFVFYFFNIGTLNNGMSLDSLFNSFVQLFSKAEMKEAYLVIFISNAIHVLKTFFLNRRYQAVSVQEIFLKPYVRVFIQQTLVIAGGLVHLFTGGNKSIVFVLIILKTAIDLTGMAIIHNTELKEKLADFILDRTKTQLPAEEKSKLKQTLVKFLD